MNCESALFLISSRMDGEISREDELTLEAHLGECAVCREEAEHLARQDASLRKAFAPRQAAAAALGEEVAAKIHAPSARPVSWLQVGLASAAGFLLAFFLFAGDSTQGKERSLATLAYATGPIEIQEIGSSRWKPLTREASLGQGTRVRTGPGALGEFLAASGVQIRLNSQTEIAFQGPQGVKLVRGQVYSRVPEETQNFRIQARSCSVALPGGQVDLRLAKEEAVLSVLGGSCKVKCSDGEQTIQSGEKALVAEGKVTEKKWSPDVLLETNWGNPIMLAKGHRDPEINQRCESLFSFVGQMKMALLSSNFEQEIRALGGACTPALTRYMQAEKPQVNERQRTDAARILADISPNWTLPYWIPLLEDPNPDVRFHASRALKRLTSKTFGCTPEMWKNRSAEQPCTLSKDPWAKWWEENKHRYPKPPLPQ